jgi:hypothetical protein
MGKEFYGDNEIGTSATRMNHWENLIQTGMMKIYM